jgi:hypothetical protein
MHNPTNYRPKHRRTLTDMELWGFGVGARDPRTRAACPDSSRTASCANGLCPAHAAMAYAEHMARHATDSIR